MVISAFGLGRWGTPVLDDVAVQWKFGGWVEYGLVQYFVQICRRTPGNIVPQVLTRAWLCAGC